MVMTKEKFYIKTRGVRLTAEVANEGGIKRVYNSTSDMDFMSKESMDEWVSSLYDKDVEAVIVESALKFVGNKPVYISSCIVFHTQEMCNVYFVRNNKEYGQNSGFFHLLN